MKTSIAIALLAFASTSACTVATVEPEKSIYELSETSKITGTISYRERIALLPGSTATLKLVDISRADTSAIVLDEVTYDLSGKNVPISFELTKPNRNQPANARLAVQAQIRSADGKLLFTTDTVHPVMTRPVDQDLGMLMMVKTR